MNETRQTPILSPDLPFRVWMDPRLDRLPGIVPMGPDDWVLADAGYAAQMAERERLIRDRPAAVHALLPQARAAAEELHAMIAARLPALGFARRGSGWVCPDGRFVADLPPGAAGSPLLVLGRLVQPDLCLLQPGPGGRHVLTGAILCFPASWTLGEKIGRPLDAIHRPVAAYDATMAARVQRLFDAIRPETPLMRGNALRYADPALHQPRREAEPRPSVPDPGYVRAERQCLLRLPATGAVVFSIQTYVVERDALDPEARAALLARRPRG